MSPTRRRVLTLAGAGLASLAGCTRSNSGDSTTGGTTTGQSQTTATATATPTAGQASRPPTADTRYHLGWDFQTLRENVVSGGVPKDGIPSIDDPTFANPGDVDHDPGDPVFGVVRDDEAKAYPQRILVYHEIVNDTLGGDPVSVTYCPLTGTVQGFERGETTFGVSGNLVNSNLVMYDRATDSRWPQVLATAISGDMQGESLQEFRVVWTTWDEWRSTHPDTKVLTEDTGYVRRYDRDPYGSYNPKGRYYENANLLFPPLQNDERGHPKDVVIGARTTEEAVAFVKSTLLEERVLTVSGEQSTFLAVSDPTLSTAYVYENPEGATVEPDGNQYVVDGQTHAPDALPLDRVLAFDAMWFAWTGLYPETSYVQ